METVISLPTEYGQLELFHFSHQGQEGIVVRNNEYSGTPFLRIHSSCLFSESFHTLDCDCASQLDAALKYIERNGGLVIYLYQEGRGLGLAEKIKAIALEKSEGIDTATAFAMLGHSADPRNYDAAIHILRTMNITEVSLATSNPEKITALTNAGIAVPSRVPLKIEKTTRISDYLKGKRKALGHHEDD